MKTFRQFLEASDMDYGDGEGGTVDGKKKKRQKKDGRNHPGEKALSADAALDVNVAVSDKGRSRGSH